MCCFLNAFLFLRLFKNLVGKFIIKIVFPFRQLFYFNNYCILSILRRRKMYAKHVILSQTVVFLLSQLFHAFFALKNIFCISFNDFFKKFLSEKCVSSWQLFCFNDSSGNLLQGQHLPDKKIKLKIINLPIKSRKIFRDKTKIATFALKLCLFVTNQKDPNPKIETDLQLQHGTFKKTHYWLKRPKKYGA